MAHPIDGLLRKTLLPLATNQKDIAKRIGRSQGWLNKYLHGVGKATIDDVVRLLAITVLGVDRAPDLTPAERRLLRDWRALAPQGRAAVKKYVAFWSAQQRRHRQPRTKSTAPLPRKNHGTSG